MSEYVSLHKIPFSGKCSHCGKKGKFATCSNCWKIMLKYAEKREKIFDRCSERLKVDEEKTIQ